MKNKSATLTIVIFLVISLTLNGVISLPAAAGTTELFTRENMVNLAKGIAAIYLLNRVNNLMNDRDDKERELIEKPAVADVNQARSTINGKIIIIDPGHGGSDPGAVGREGLKEKDVTLDIALRVAELLKANTNARIYLTRDSDQYVSLNQRSAMANNLGADAFISIHINGAENGIEQGIETYAHYGAPQEAWSLAWYLQESLVKGLGLSDRGLKADNFHVVRETNNMKSVLLEVGFITDRAEEALLRESSTREKTARAIYNGILTYYSKQ